MDFTAFITAMVLCVMSQDLLLSVSVRRVHVVFSTAGFKGGGKPRPKTRETTARSYFCDLFFASNRLRRLCSSECFFLYLSVSDGPANLKRFFSNMASFHITSLQVQGEVVGLFTSVRIGRAWGSNSPSRLIIAF